MNKSLDDTEILNWLDNHLYEIYRPVPVSGNLMMDYRDGKNSVYGKGLREVVKKVMERESGNV